MNKQPGGDRRNLARFLGPRLPQLRKSDTDDKHRGNEAWEQRVTTVARAFPYPAAPDIVDAVRTRLDEGTAPVRRYAPRAAVALAVLLVVLLAVPDVRAAVFRVIRLGAIRILTTRPDATPVPTIAPSPTEPAAIPTAPAAIPTRARTGTPALPGSLADLAGRTTLAEARRASRLAVPLPTYPPGLDEPDFVFLQAMGAPVVIVAWTDPDHPDRVRLSLWAFGPGTHAEKIEPRIVQETTVNGRRALWTEGEHLLVLRDLSYAPRRLVVGNTLIWSMGSVTYRIETDLPLEEAVKIAESVE